MTVTTLLTHARAGALYGKQRAYARIRTHAHARTHNAHARTHTHAYARTHA